MGRQIRLLTKISLCNLFGLNEFRFTKDKKKKSRYCLMGVMWLMLLAMLVFYVCAVSLGLLSMGAGELVPAVLTMCVAVVVFFFTMIKAGPELFDNRAYEKQIALPVETKAIIASRFFAMYLTNMLLGMLVMFPGMAVYGLMERPGITFYLYGLVGSLFLPLLPLLIASVAGALIAGISSRWKNRMGKNLVMIVLTMLLVCGVLAGSLGMSQMEERDLEAMVLQLVPVLGERIKSTYPPAVWLSEAMTEGKVSRLFLFATLPLTGFLIFLEILRPFYGKVCKLLSAGTSKSKDGYVQKELRVSSPIRSMTERELRRYFSSVVYVTNTMVGEVMMVLLAGLVGVMGTEAVDAMLGMEGTVERALPVLLGMLPAMMPMTASAISMEGKQWWMMQTFPVSKRALRRSKMLANLLVVFPFYLVSELILLFAMKPDWVGAISILSVPAVYVIFSARVGLAINSRFPVFDWESETRVVKQSASVSLMILVGMVPGVVSLAGLVLFRAIPAVAVYVVTATVLVAVVILLNVGGDSKKENFFL